MLQLETKQYYVISCVLQMMARNCIGLGCWLEVPSKDNIVQKNKLFRYLETLICARQNIISLPIAKHNDRPFFACCPHTEHKSRPNYSAADPAAAAGGGCKNKTFAPPFHVLQRVHRHANDRRAGTQAALMSCLTLEQLKLCSDSQTATI
jgi:hypothetical protein